MTRYNKQHRCPICRGDHSCSRTDDGLHFCWREHAPVVGWVYFGDDAKEGFGLFRHESDTRRGGGQRSGQTASTKQAGKPRPVERPEVDWDRWLAGHRCGGRELWELAERLGVEESALARLGVAYSPETYEDLKFWATPMRDGSGRVVGISRRYPTGKKLSLGHNGLFYAPDWSAGAGAVWVVEGASDTAALLGCGLRAVGRPSNTGGVAYLCELLGGLADGTEVVIVGENDLHHDGRWPGKEGALKTSRAVADACPHLRVFWALPPGVSKDARQWTDGRSGEEVGREWDRLARGQGLVWVPSATARATYSIDTQKEETKSITLIPDTVLDLLHPRTTAAPPHCACPHRVTEVLAHAHKPGLHRVGSLPCRCWGCQVCRKGRSAEWSLHLGGLFEETLREGWGLYALAVTDDDRDAARNAVRRATAATAGSKAERKSLAPRYAELQSADGTRLLIFALPLLAVLRGKLLSARKLSRLDAATVLDDWSYGMRESGPPRAGKRCRPVTASEAWALARTIRTGNWRRVGGCMAQDERTVEACLESLQRQGAVRLLAFDLDALSPSVRPPYAWALEFVCAPGHAGDVLARLSTLDDEPPDPPDLF